MASAEQVVAAGGSPLAVLRAVADAIRVEAAGTDGTVDDAVAHALDAAVVEVEAGIRRTLVALDVLTSGCLTVAEALADPRVRQALDQAITSAIDAGWRAGGVKTTLRAWLAE